MQSLASAMASCFSRAIVARRECVMRANPHELNKRQHTNSTTATSGRFRMDKKEHQRKEIHVSQALHDTAMDGQGRVSCSKPTTTRSIGGRLDLLRWHSAQ